ncbi:MAG TPA: permease [Pseudonocardiaceae bacterium]|nr:permease [Pseudonocardiaceae bacterium]
MSTLDASARARRVTPAAVLGTVVVLVLSVLGLLWAKWIPYGHKAQGLSVTHAWSGASIFSSAGAPGAAPSWRGAWDFTVAYGQSVWQAALVGLLVGAAVESLLPKSWLLRLLDRRSSFGRSAAGGVAALPSLMCTCCTAPMAVGLRRRGVSAEAAVSYWLGNPVLNPAVLVFLFLVAPWQVGVVRIVVGVVLVFGAVPLVVRLVNRGRTSVPDQVAVPDDAGGVADLPGRFLRSLARLAVVLVPEYLVVVLLVGLVSGWLADFAGLDQRLGVLAVVICAVVGTLLVIPTAGEIPVVLALAAAGAGLGTAGALLVTLPALSLPSMVMVGRALSWRVTTAMAATVVMAGLLSGLLLWAIG